MKRDTISYWWGVGCWGMGEFSSKKKNFAQEVTTSSQGQSVAQSFTRLKARFGCFLWLSMADN